MILITVDIDIMQAMDRIVCTFHVQQSDVQERACHIVYGPMEATVELRVNRATVSLILCAIGRY